MTVRTEPITFSMAFNLKASSVLRAGAIDVALNCDTNLFVDPCLLADSKNKEFARCARSTYEKRFSTIVDLLSESQAEGDFAWRNAERLFVFPEAPFTHLGYSGGLHGSGSGAKIRASLMRNSREAIRIGIRDPDLFLVLALLEEGVGADRISDMATRIIQPCFGRFTSKIADELGVPCKAYRIDGDDYHLPKNPLARSDEPVILVPNDIVRDLPTASDWDSVASAARETEEIRARVSAQIGEIWAVRTRKDKDQIRRTLLSNRQAFEEFLALLLQSAGEPYDVREDHLGEIYPADLRRELLQQMSRDSANLSGRQLNSAEVATVVQQIIYYFRSMIESNGIWELLYDDDRVTPKREKAAQRLFFAVAAAYCEANKLDLSPEADAGCGPVDFKVSQGSLSKVIVEIKKSTNPKLVDAYESQLGAYIGAERPYASHYVVLDVGRLTPFKRAGLNQLRNSALQRGAQAPSLWVIDAMPKQSASHR